MKMILHKCIATAIVFVSGFNVTMGQIAIIVNENNPINNVSENQLKSIYLGNHLFYEDNTPIVLSEYSEDKEAFCNTLFRYSAKQFSKYWFELIFSGSSAKSPKLFKSKEALIAFIAEHEGAIGYLLASKADQLKGCKIIKVNDLNYSDANYPLLEKTKNKSSK